MKEMFSSVLKVFIVYTFIYKVKNIVDKHFKKIKQALNLVLLQN